MIMDRIALVLAIIGGLNWGSIGLFRFDIVAWLFGGQTATVSRVVYTLVGLAAPAGAPLLSRGGEEAAQSAKMERGRRGVPAKFFLGLRSL